MSRVAVVTGASGGMGSATVREFKSKGYVVIGVDSKGNSAECDHFFQGDICDESLWGAIATAISEQYGKVDALVNIAGRNYLSLIDSADLAQWRNMFEVNVIGMVTSIKHLKRLLDKGEAPAIVNMSSISGYIGSVGYAAYCSTKGAVDSLTKSLALELAPKIRVNAIAPGWIETPFTVEGLEKSADPVAYRRDVEAMHALNRVGKPEEIAQSIYWMCSPESSFMTGTVVIVDGGYMIKN
jgi:NAD(P)-dependent dehydrogenase (short-subunit alcohol dehydrogenase family)